MIGVAFFAFSSYVCLAQAQAQEKELAASPNKRKDEFSELRKFNGTVIVFGTLLKVKFVHESLTVEVGKVLRTFLFDPLAYCLLETFLEFCPGLRHPQYDDDNRRVISFGIASIIGHCCVFATAFAIDKLISPLCT